jgi:hypothetical protein
VECEEQQTREWSELFITVAGETNTLAIPSNAPDARVAYSSG